MSAFVDALRAADKAATGAPWAAVRLTNEGREFTPDEFATYVRNSLAKGVGADIFAAMCEKPDGPADVAHFGNGPTSAENLALAVLLRNAAPEIAALVEAGDALRHYDDPTVLLKASELAPLRAALSRLEKTVKP